MQSAIERWKLVQTDQADVKPTLSQYDEIRLKWQLKFWASTAPYDYIVIGWQQNLIRH